MEGEDDERGNLMCTRREKSVCVCRAKKSTFANDITTVRYITSLRISNRLQNYFVRNAVYSIRGFSHHCLDAFTLKVPAQ